MIIIVLQLFLISNYFLLSQSLTNICGKTIVSLEGDKRTKTPWTALIFLQDPQNSGQYIGWMSGIIVSKLTIITRGINFWDHSNSRRNGTKWDNVSMFGFQPFNILVGVGLKNHHDLIPDSFTQILSVEFIRPYPKSYIEHSNFDIAIIRLETPITFSVAVRPVCVANSPSPELFLGPHRLSGFQYFTPFELNAVTYNLTAADICNAKCQQNAPISTIEQLRNHGPPCRSRNDPRNRFLVGASLTAWHSDRWHLIGIVSKSYGCHLNYSHFISLVGGTQKVISWINSYKINDDFQRYNCIDGQSIALSEVCNGHVDCLKDGGSDEDETFCEAYMGDKNRLNEVLLNGNSKGDRLILVRNSNISLSTIKIQKGHSDSKYGMDASTRAPQITTMPSLMSTTEYSTTTTINTPTKVLPINVTSRCPYVEPEEGFRYQCIAPGHAIKDPHCKLPSFPGTKMLISCKDYYKSAGSISYTVMLCMDSGSWKKNSRHTFTCTLECGIPKASINPTIVNGTVATTSHWPWNAALFLQKQSLQQPAYICGATLIGVNVLITAAHCLSHKTGQPTDKDKLRIILAPTSSSFNENDRHSQIVGVASIHIHENYNPLTLEGDIAIIILNTTATISDLIYPACFPFPKKENEQIERFQLSSGNFGIVVGFGIDESTRISPVLKQAKLPVISVRDCYKVIDIFPSNSQICAGYTTGISLCNGDSGAGFIFQEEGARKLFFILGIVSHGQHGDGNLQCDKNKYSILTRVGAFKHWVEDIVYAHS